LFLAIFCAAVSALQQRFSRLPTPAGWVLANCDHEVENGASLRKLPTGGLLVTNPDGSTWTIPVCDTMNGTQKAFISQSTKSRLSRAIRGTPNAYDGWTAYVEFDIPSPGFDTFTGKFSVPDKPASTPQVLYIFPGLQNIDWIPVVDPDPTDPFDIIQPVLQYPGDAGAYWSVKSWYVVLDVGTVHSKEVRVDSGDVIFGNMTRTGSTSWYIGSTSIKTGQTTEITVDHSRLATQPWAYNTIECYGCNGCKTYPLQAEIFSELVLTQKGTTIPAKWKINPKPSQNEQCGEKPVVTNGSYVEVNFQK